MSRFYTNPFVKDAPTVFAISYGEWRFLGYSITGDGVTADYGRDVTYSDGSVRIQDEQRPSELCHSKTTGCLYVDGKQSRTYYPVSPAILR